MLLLHACGAHPKIQPQASKSKARFERALTDARSIGVPEAMLKPIVYQAQQLAATSAPLTLLDDQPANDYYSNLTQRYQMLTVQVSGLQTQATQQLNYQAYTDLQNFASILVQRQAQGLIPAKHFVGQLNQQQNLMNQAQYPKDYMQISSKARTAIEALYMMGVAYERLTTLRTSIKQLEASNIDVTALKQLEQYDIEQFHNATKLEDFTLLINQMNAQSQMAMTLSTQAIPYVSAARLDQFQRDIEQMKQYGIDVSTYRKQLASDRVALSKARTSGDYLKVSSQINSHTSASQILVLQAEARHLLKQYNKEVADWGRIHQFRNAYDGKLYPLNFPYMTQGLAEDLEASLQTAESREDYQAVIDLIKNSLLHLKASEADYSDKTPWKQPHKSDLALLKHHELNSGKVIVVSLVHQAMRIYEDGKLIKAYLVTTGQYDRPTPPGLWRVYAREAPTRFKSSEPKGSAFWYPDTRINYAMLFREGGYYIHDSWWRLDYGPGTQFPHVDSGGNQVFAFNGSHGCINLPTDQARWVYENTGYSTVVVY
jgi:hypothetical protein